MKGELPALAGDGGDIAETEAQVEGIRDGGAVQLAVQGEHVLFVPFEGVV